MRFSLGKGGAGVPLKVLRVGRGGIVGDEDIDIVAST